ncbi:MAG TPA: DPP IV N-terminal domain-containing protein [Nitrospirales bacterium]
MEAKPLVYQFDDVRVDLGSCTVTKAGSPVQLEPKAFSVLVFLIENGSQLAEKSEILTAVWKDAFVTDNALTRVIAQLRKALGEESKDTKYIETVHTRGYRFLPAVEVDGGDHVEARRSEPTRGLTVGARFRRSTFLWVCAGLAFVILAGGIAWIYFSEPRGKALTPRPRINAITSFQGHESNPAFSPDGNQVAFVWDGEAGDNLDIYVKLTDTGVPLRLTKHPGADFSPAWSPDGRYVAFMREWEGNGGIYLVPSLGGPERKLADVFAADRSGWGWRYLNWLSWAPDGKSLAVADKSSASEPFSIFLLSILTGEKRRLTSPPAGFFGERNPAFSPDGKTMAFTRASGFRADDLYVMPVAGGEPRRLTFDKRSIIGLTWTRDGRDIIFSSNREGSSTSITLWRISASGGTPERLSGVGQNAFDPVVSRQGNRLAYTQLFLDANIWRMEVSRGGGGTPIQLISSTREDSGPQFSPDGRKIAFASDRSGALEIYACDSDGLNAVQLTFFNSQVQSPYWSPDGRQITFDSIAGGSPDIWVVSAEGGPPRRLTTEPSEDIRPSWSRDGRLIYFASDRSGTWQVWKVPSAGGHAIQVTKKGGFAAFESPDGKYVYYSKGHRDVPGIWRIPVGGGEEVPVMDLPRVRNWGYWAVVEKGIYFVSAEKSSRPLVEFFSFTTGLATQIAQLEKPILPAIPGFAVSPDGRWILYVQLDQSGSDIMLMENFR